MMGVRNNRGFLTKCVYDYIVWGYLKERCMLMKMNSCFGIVAGGKLIMPARLKIGLFEIGVG